MSTPGMDEAAAISHAVALLAAVGQGKSIRRVAALIELAHGKHAIRWATIAKAIKVLPGNTSGNTAATPRQQIEEAPATSRQQSATATRAPADLSRIGLSSAQGVEIGVATETNLPSVDQSDSPSLTLDLPAKQPALLPVLSRPDSNPAKTAKQKPLLRADKRTGAERTADEAITLLRPRIEPVLAGMTWATWRQRNRRIVVDMAQAGMSPAEIDAAHRVHSGRKGWAATIEMRWVQAALTNGSVPLGVADDDGLEDNPFYIPEGPDDPPWEPTDLKLEDIPEEQRAPWRLPMDHWRYRPNPMAL